ncbi:MAG: Npun_F0494 family protein [Cyanobacteria bacterium P01_F01_bin.143]
MSTTFDSNSTTYPIATIIRATRAFCCSPFKLQLFTAMQSQGISSQTIAGEPGVAKNYVIKNLTENQAESYLVWLINVGLLRREVDGQGLTDSFRLTPLGRQVIAQWQTEDNFPQPTAKDRLYNFINRWLEWSL